MEHIKEFIISWWNNTFNFSSANAIYKSITNIILLIFSFLLLYRTLYTIIGFFMRGKKYEKAPMDKKYACVISARNESQVIGNLIDSIKRQSYPSELDRKSVV